MSSTAFENNLVIYFRQHEDLHLSSLNSITNISRQTLYNIFNEKHQIKMSSAIKISKALDISFIQMNTPRLFETPNLTLQSFEKSLETHDFLLIFAQNIKRKLDLNNKWQVALSTVPGVSASEISNILKGKITDPLLTTLETICYQSGFHSLSEAFTRR
ncbi:MAG: helix-turn-helix transcriptional regulator [Lactobacillus sp.]|nr:helix-turn-helix transcriptional regulator [Lactobacillus sp.]